MIAWTQLVFYSDQLSGVVRCCDVSSEGAGWSLAADRLKLQPKVGGMMTVTTGAATRQQVRLASVARLSQAAEGEVAWGGGVRAGEELADCRGEFCGVQDAVAVEVELGEGSCCIPGAGPVCGGEPGVLPGV